MKEVVARFASLSPAKQALLQKAQKAAGSNGLKEEPIFCSTALVVLRPAGRT